MNRGRVLVVSDDSSDVKWLEGLLARSFTRSTPHFDHASNCAGALGRLVDDDYDAVVLAGQVDGKKAPDLLWSQVFTAFETPVIYLGGDEEPVEAARALHAGAAEAISREDLTPEIFRETLRYARILKVRERRN